MGVDLAIPVDLTGAWSTQVYGLYAALFPAFVYGILGTSSELAVGPVAIVSLQVASGLAEVISQDDPMYPTYCFMVALVAGCLQVSTLSPRYHRGASLLGIEPRFQGASIPRRISSSALVLNCSPLVPRIHPQRVTKITCAT
jgi:hypothetical protein